MKRDIFVSYVIIDDIGFGFRNTIMTIHSRITEELLDEIHNKLSDKNSNKKIIVINWKILE